MVRFKGLEYYYLTTLASVLWTVCDAELTDAKAEDKSLDSVCTFSLHVSRYSSANSHPQTRGNLPFNGAIPDTKTARWSSDR